MVPFSLLAVSVLFGTSLANMVRRHSNRARTEPISAFPSLGQGLWHPDALMQLGSLATVPCRLHQTWKTKNMSLLEPAIVNSMSSWKNNNPECEYRLWDDTEMDSFMASHNSLRDLVPTEVWKQLPPIQKADIFRYAVIYILGGFYSDIDVTDLKPISTWGWDNTTQLVVGYETGYHLNESTRKKVGFTRDEQFEQWAFGAVPGHPVLRRCLELFRQKLTWGIEDTVELTGPGVYSDAIHEFLHEYAHAKANSLTALTLTLTVTPAPPQEAVHQNHQNHQNHPPLRFLPPGFRDAGILILSAEQMAAGGFSAGGVTEKTLIRHGFRGTWKHES